MWSPHLEPEDVKTTAVLPTDRPPPLCDPSHRFFVMVFTKRRPNAHKVAAATTPVALLELSTDACVPLAMAVQLLLLSFQNGIDCSFQAASVRHRNTLQYAGQLIVQHGRRSCHTPLGEFTNVENLHSATWKERNHTKGEKLDNARAKIALPVFLFFVPSLFRAIVSISVLSLHFALFHSVRHVSFLRNKGLDTTV